MDRNEILSILINTSDFCFGNYLFLSEFKKDKISDDNRCDMIDKSIDCGKMEANRLLKRYSNMSVVEILQQMKVVVNLERECKETENRYLFGFYEHPNKINVILSSCDLVIDSLSNFNYKFKELITMNTVVDLVIAHELFHFIEYYNKKTIYTKTKKNGFGFVLSEIAAMSFAKILVNTSFNPLILNYLFLDLKAPNLAFKFAKQIISIQEF